MYDFSERHQDNPLIQKKGGSRELSTRQNKMFNEDKKYLYTRNELEEYEKFIIDNYGEFKEIMHEIVSPDIHLDIIVVPPTKEHNYYKLITMGMGAYKMKTPQRLARYRLQRAELVMYLPADWNIKSNIEEDFWPIRYLKAMARLPVTNNSWLGFGHTMSLNNEGDTYADNTKFCSLLLVTALDKEYQKLECKLSSGKKINFYQLFPLYAEELEYKLQNGANELLDLVDDEDIIPIINIKEKIIVLNK